MTERPDPAGMAAGELVGAFAAATAHCVPGASLARHDRYNTLHAELLARLTPAPVARERVEEVMAYADVYAQAWVEYSYASSADLDEARAALRAAVEALVHSSANRTPSAVHGSPLAGDT